MIDEWHEARRILNEVMEAADAAEGISRTFGELGPPPTTSPEVVEHWAKLHPELFEIDQKSLQDVRERVKQLNHDRAFVQASLDPLWKHPPRSWPNGLGLIAPSLGTYLQPSNGFVVLGGKAITIPLWAIFVPAAITAGIQRHMRIRKRLLGHCPNCRYNLHANTTGRCPECGTPIRPSTPTPTAADSDTNTPEAGHA